MEVVCTLGFVLSRTAQGFHSATANNRTRVDLTDVHREHLDRGEPFPAAASPVRRAHDGAVQGRQLWGAQPASLRDRGRLLQVCVFWSIISVDTIRFIG